MLPFVIKIFVLSIFGGRFTQVLLYSHVLQPSPYQYCIIIMKIDIHKTNNKGTLVFHFEVFLMLPKSYNRYGVQVNTGYDLQVQQHLPNTCRPYF